MKKQFIAFAIILLFLSSCGDKGTDNNNSNNDGCSADCSTIEDGYLCPTVGSACDPICGDGLVKGNEACDDGNTDNLDGCSSTC